MRKRGKTFLITTEQHEVVIVRSEQADPRRAFCPLCADEVDVLSFDAAIGLAGISGRVLARGIETGRIHSMQTSGNDFGVCGRSLEMEKENVSNEEK